VPRSDSTAATNAAAVANGTLGANATPRAAARVVAAYPNPVASEDRGEFVVVRLPPPGSGVRVALSDGESTVRLPVADAPGNLTIAVSPEPGAARSTTDLPVVEGSLALANDGERLRLLADGSAIDRVEYADAPEGERWRRDGTPRWFPVGLRDRPVRPFGSACATAFLLPDSPEVPLETLRRADRRILLAGYTFTSRPTAEALVAAADRGVSVRVLVEGEPVGGASARQAAALDYLAANGVEVEVSAGPRARFSYHHPKYAVVDDRALVLTENWKPAGTGGRDSRGWGVRVRSPELAAALADTFRGDAGWRDTVRWERFRSGRRFREAPPANGSYPERRPPRRVNVERVRLVTAPGNAETALVGVVDNASERVDVVQPTLGGRGQPFVRAAVRAADRGVRVRVLLSSAWYVADENRALAERLNRLAERRGVPLAVRVARPGARFGKIHAKGVVADDVAVVGSLNWNNHSARENREVALALTGDEVAGYYRRSFEADWKASRAPFGDGDRLPVGLAVAAVVAVLAAVGVATRLEFAE
jgi:phosphatidylserine/phosphatidylglycerophosphate/cardiolipin synthase-like enzyme